MKRSNIKITVMMFLVMLSGISFIFYMVPNIFISQEEKSSPQELLNDPREFPHKSSSEDDYVFGWNATLGTIYEDRAIGVAVDSDDNVYVSGFQDLSGSNTNRDMVLVKYNPLGEQQWVQYWGGSNDDLPFNILIDSSDNIFIVGLTKSFGDVDGDAVVIKYNTTGHQQWNFTWGGDQYDFAEGIGVDSSNNFYVGGGSQSFADIDGDAFLVKFDENWIEQWNITWGGSDNDETNYLHIDNNDDIYIAGASFSLDPSPGEADAFLNKYNSSGDLQWSENWGGSYGQRGLGIATDSSNDVYIVCRTFGHPASSGKGAIVKYDSAGTYQWEKIWGVNGAYNYMYRIVIDSNDELYISGTTSSFGLPSNYDAILFNYDTNGNQNWYKIWAEYEWDLAFDLCMDSQANIYIAGDTISYSAGQKDMLLLKYNFTRKITIITPQNKTYIEPMSGYYPSTYGFENDINGIGTPLEWGNDTEIGYTLSVLEEKDGHKKVVEFLDNSAVAGFPNLFNDIPNPPSNGTIEMWLMVEDASDSRINFNGLDTSNDVGFYFWLAFDEWTYNDVGLSNTKTIPNVPVPQDNTWFHLRIDFRCVGAPAYLGLSENTYYVIVNGISSGELDCRENPINVERFLFTGDDDNTITFWIDAIGYSWDPHYNIGDNLKEGLMLSYESSTTLDWKGYSLDGTVNNTILGNTTIPLPTNGPHNIQVFGNDSLGTIYHSNVRHFAVNRNPSLDIITPENKTYTGPMSGYFPGTFGFENDKVGENPDFFGVDETGGEVNMVSELDGHKNIVGIFDTSGGDWPYFYNDFDTPLTHGSYEYWVRTTDASDFQGLRLYSGSIIDTNVMIDLVIDNEKFRYYDGSWHDIADCVDNQWYHIEIAFECTTGGYRGLSQYTFKVWIDGVEYGEFGYWYIKPSATSIQFMGGGGLTKNLYVDAIGYDWDPNYHMGDNLYEGLLLIYNSTGILDWLGYSLDGQTNQTIFGNTTINLPSNGLHSIQVFGNDSIGNSYESNLRYFTVATGAPDITINSPLDNDFFGSTAPNYDISILGLYENVWYTIDAGLTNITVSALT
ncbi:MAG: SBBP repeat-containing protein, partial [Promethearchaeota archaeon]